MRMLLSIYGSREAVAPVAGIAVRLGAGKCGVPAAAGVLSTGVRR